MKSKAQIIHRCEHCRQERVCFWHPALWPFHGYWLCWECEPWHRGRFDVAAKRMLDLIGRQEGIN